MVNCGKLWLCDKFVRQMLHLINKLRDTKSRLTLKNIIDFSKQTIILISFSLGKPVHSDALYWILCNCYENCLIIDILRPQIEQSKYLGSPFCVSLVLHRCGAILESKCQFGNKKQKLIYGEWSIMLAISILSTHI